jgi:hypothetical protein
MSLPYSAGGALPAALQRCSMFRNNCADGSARDHIRRWLWPQFPVSVDNPACATIQPHLHTIHNI